LRIEDSLKNEDWELSYLLKEFLIEMAFDLGYFDLLVLEEGVVLQRLHSPLVVVRSRCSIHQLHQENSLQFQVYFS
jgi:hypothetical protein